MATITIRLDKESEQILQELEVVYKYRRVKRSAIVKAAIQALYLMSENEREQYLHHVRVNDGRRVNPYIL